MKRKTQLSECENNDFAEKPINHPVDGISCKSCKNILKEINRQLNVLDSGRSSLTDTPAAKILTPWKEPCSQLNRSVPDENILSFTEESSDVIRTTQNLADESSFIVDQFINPRRTPSESVRNDWSHGQISPEIVAKTSSLVLDASINSTPSNPLSDDKVTAESFTSRRKKLIKSLPLSVTERLSLCTSSAVESTRCSPKTIKPAQLFTFSFEESSRSSAAEMTEPSFLLLRPTATSSPLSSKLIETDRLFEKSSMECSILTSGIVARLVEFFSRKSIESTRMPRTNKQSKSFSIADTIESCTEMSTGSDWPPPGMVAELIKIFVDKPVEAVIFKQFSDYLGQCTEPKLLSLTSVAELIQLFNGKPIDLVQSATNSRTDNTQSISGFVSQPQSPVFSHSMSHLITSSNSITNSTDSFVRSPVKMNWERTHSTLLFNSAAKNPEFFIAPSTKCVQRPVRLTDEQSTPLALLNPKVTHASSESVDSNDSALNSSTEPITLTSGLFVKPSESLMRPSTRSSSLTAAIVTELSSSLIDTSTNPTHMISDSVVDINHSSAGSSDEPVQFQKLSKCTDSNHPIARLSTGHSCLLLNSSNETTHLLPDLPSDSKQSTLSTVSDTAISFVGPSTESTQATPTAVPEHPEISTDASDSQLFMIEICESCPICLEEYKDLDEALLMPCGHFCHARCLNDWLEISTTCPICRKDV